VDRHETGRILKAIEAARAADEPVALATIVRVIGSAYRREGTRMIVGRDGRYECMLSGGCLEPAIVELAQQIIAGGEPRTVRYDLAEDVVWGLGLGCGGTVDVRIERLDERDAITRAWLEALRQGTPTVLVTPLDAPGGRLLVFEDGAVLGSLGAGLDPQAIARARERLRGANERSGPERLHGVELFFDVCGPPPDLVVFGAGHDAVPLVRLAHDLGFMITVVDVRDGYLTSGRFPGARLVHAPAGELERHVSPGPRSFVLIMNHNLARDEESLRCAFESAAHYIGVMGPRSRYDRLMSGLTADGYLPNASRLAAVRSPVGLALGAETPEQVAVSVLGEIMALRYGFDGGFLSGLPGAIHKPEDTRRLARS